MYLALLSVYDRSYILTQHNVPMAFVTQNTPMFTKTFVCMTQNAKIMAQYTSTKVHCSSLA